MQGITQHSFCAWLLPSKTLTAASETLPSVPHGT